MVEQKALAYANLYGALGALENLCALDEQAKEILKSLKKPVSLCFEIQNGPSRTFHFTQEGCRITEGSEGCTCKMRFASPEKFNALVNDSKPGVPVKGAITLLQFLLGPFTALTNRLQAVLRPSEEQLQDRAFFEENTLLTMYVIAGAISGAGQFRLHCYDLGRQHGGRRYFPGHPGTGQRYHPCKGSSLHNHQSAG